MLLQSSPLLSSVSRMEFNDVKCFTTAWSLGRFALAQGEKGRCATSVFHSYQCAGLLVPWWLNKMNLNSNPRLDSFAWDFTIQVSSPTEASTDIFLAPLCVSELTLFHRAGFHGTADADEAWHQCSTNAAPRHPSLQSADIQHLWMQSVG